MKLAEFDDIPGKTDEEKLAVLFEITNRGPVYVQPKLNGVHFDYANGVFTTKNGKVWSQGFFGTLIPEAFRAVHNPVNRILHGEITAVDSSVKLATLAGWVNVNSFACSAPDKIEFNVYDTHRIDCAEPFSYRLRATEELLANPPEVIKLVDTFAAPDVAQADEMYERVIEFGGEGVVYRVNPDYYYDGRSVSDCAWRRKKWYEMEGRIVAAFQGLGKRETMLGGFIVECIMPNGAQVNLSVGGGKNLTNAQLTRLWNDRERLLGYMATIRYQELSINNTPLRAQLVCVRNYE